MTRINVGIHPKELPTKMLIAEHREIKRIPNCIKIGRYSLIGIPSKFTLGTGHVKFFYNKIGYLKRRYSQIYEECISRGYNVTDYSESFENIPEQFMSDYNETEDDRKLLIARLQTKNVYI